MLGCIGHSGGPAKLSFQWGSICKLSKPRDFSSSLSKEKKHHPTHPPAKERCFLTGLVLHGCFLQLSVLLVNYVTSDRLLLSAAFLKPFPKMFSKEIKAATPVPGINSAPSIEQEEHLAFSLSLGNVTAKPHGK